MNLAPQKSPPPDSENYRGTGKSKVLPKGISQKFLIGRLQLARAMAKKDENRWSDSSLNQVFNFKQRPVKAPGWINPGKFLPELI